MILLNRPRTITRQTQIEKLSRYYRDYIVVIICLYLFIYLQEQTQQHAVTIVAMEERLLRLTRQNRQLEQEAMHAKQTTG